MQKCQSKSQPIVDTENSELYVWLALSRPGVIGSVIIQYTSSNVDYVVGCFIVSADMDYVAE